MMRNYTNLFRINLAECYLIDDNNLAKKITPRPRIIFDHSAIVLVSKLDQKVYNFTGINASEEKQAAAEETANNLGRRLGFSVEQITYPAEYIPPEHLLLIEYFAEEHYLPKHQLNLSKHYFCYFCEQPLIRRNNNTCANCGKEIPECFVCNFPILYGDLVGKCSLCGATAHLVHFYEWIKSLGMCPKCNEKLQPEGIIPITEENKDSFF
ncbi:MAG: hypothetical protein ACTSXA_09645 [Candidatus Heimdallarchaeota archaeon]